MAAGYFIYGTSTMLAMTLGQGVVMFSLDPTTQEYLRIDNQVKIDESATEYAINASNYRYWLDPIKEYINGLVAGDMGIRNKDYNMRWVAAMIADVHRILIRGGVFMYPFDTKIAGKAGKLRLMYEANPMSFIIEQAGGASTDGVVRIMDIQPSHIHQRIPVVLGAKEEVDYVKIYTPKQVSWQMVRWHNSPKVAIKAAFDLLALCYHYQLSFMITHNYDHHF